jgi:hypothetical protein
MEYRTPLPAKPAASGAEQPDLAALAAVICREHADVTLAAANLIEHALRAGDALIAAKAAVGHGRWLPWLKEECDLSEDRAERYMRIARGRATLEADSARVRNLSLAGALKLLPPPGRESGALKRKTAQGAASFDARAQMRGAFRFNQAAGCAAISSRRIETMKADAMLQFRQPNICPRCRQVIPPTGLRLSKIKQRIYDIVRSHPDISAEELRGLVWERDPGGGPECRHTIFVHVAQLNDLLRPHGIMVRSQGGGYRIRSVP